MKTAKAKFIVSTCIWTQEDGWDMESVYNTACGQASQFEDGTPEDNRFVYCPYCGHPIEVVMAPKKIWEEEEDENVTNAHA